MTALQRRQKILNSFPVQFVLWGSVVAALVEDFANDSFSPIRFVAVFVTVGFIVPKLNKEQIGSKISTLPGIPQTDQDWILYDHVRKGTMPNNAKLLAALPAYLKERELANYQNKAATPGMISIGLFAASFGLITIHPVVAVLGLGILTMAAYSIVQDKKITENTAKLKQKLARNN
jgi:hypothetical protein